MLHLGAVAGYGLMYEETSFDEFVCPTHARKVYRQFQRQSALRGWWSIRGFIRTPNLLAENARHYELYRKTPSR